VILLDDRCDTAQAADTATPRNALGRSRDRFIVGKRPDAWMKSIPPPAAALRGRGLGEVLGLILGSTISALSEPQPRAPKPCKTDVRSAP
jgi:hypothetical protein